MPSEGTSVLDGGGVDKKGLFGLVYCLMPGTPAVLCSQPILYVKQEDFLALKETDADSAKR